MHPGSVNFSQGAFSVPFLLYHEVVRTSKAFLRDSTEASAYALLLAATSLKVQHHSGRDRGREAGGGSSTWARLLLDDGWVRFAAVGRIAALVSALKARVEAVLDHKVNSPELELSSAPEVRALIKLIATDGMG